jgi:protein-S-isoprenylcysteine O-methyltransferase Ste14
MITQLAKTAFQPNISLMVAKVYIPMLFPLTFLISYAALGIDGMLGMSEGFLQNPGNLAGAGLCFLAGAALWLMTYEQLSRLGEGSPSPTAGRTLRLVRSGIYAYSRNPSLFGKLLGFFSVGLAINSFSFCFILTPLLLAGSLAEKVLRQEPQLIEIFGSEYEKYRAEVPLFIPWKLFSTTPSTR